MNASSQSLSNTEQHLAQPKARLQDLMYEFWVMPIAVFFCLSILHHLQSLNQRWTVITRLHNYRKTWHQVYWRILNQLPLVSTLRSCYTWSWKVWPAYRHHINIRDSIVQGYQKMKGQIFALPVPWKNIFFITTEDQMKEVLQAPENQLSFNAAIEEHFIPSLVFNGFEFKDKDPRNAVPLNALRTKLRQNLGKLLPDLDKRMREVLESHIASAGPAPGCQGTSTIRPLMLADDVITAVNNMLMVGKELSLNPAYLKEIKQYSMDVLVTTEALRWTPRFLSRPVGWCLMNWSGAKNSVHARIMKVLDNRLDPDTCSNRTENDLIQWMIENSRHHASHNKERLAQHALGLLFGAVHQMPMFTAFVLFRLCQYPEYIQSLREEMRVVGEAEQDPLEYYDKLIRLESFMKETARLNPIVSMNLWRKVVQPFNFENGLTVDKGNWICLPQEAIMTDPAYYSKPHDFDPSRFLDVYGNMDVNKRFTESTFEFSFWGSPKHPCPGRFYATIMMKMIIVYILQNYDIELVDRKVSGTFTYAYATVPNPMVKMRFQKRN